jgi:hypothetical protein
MASLTDFQAFLVFPPSSACGGPPACKLPHSEEELREWVARWNHRDLRREQSSHLAKVDSRNGIGIPISASKVGVPCLGKLGKAGKERILL